MIMVFKYYFHTVILYKACIHVYIVSRVYNYTQLHNTIRVIPAYKHVRETANLCAEGYIWLAAV